MAHPLPSVRACCTTDRFSPICTYSGCPDAFHYWNDYSKTHVVNTGGTFTIVFCA
jgi:hypothetical protein